MSTHAEHALTSGRVYIMMSCAAPEGVYTQKPLFLLEMHLDVSTLKRPVLLLDMSTLQRAAPGRVYTTEAGAEP
jgi:hypothetical protein